MKFILSFILFLSVIMVKHQIISGSSNLNLSKKIAEYLNIPLTSILLDQFANTEIRTQVNESVRYKHVYIIQTGGYTETMSVNDYLWELILICQSCKLAGSKTITVIMPCFPYARQDKKTTGREPISARAVADTLQLCCGVQRVITMDLHSGQIQGFFNIPVDNLYAINLITDYLNTNVINNRSNYVAISPDAGAAKRTLAYGDKLGLDTLIMHKDRNYDGKNMVNKVILVGENNSVKNKRCIIIDDMADTCGTVCEAAKTLIEEHNALEVVVVVTHGILSGPAIDRINDSKHISRLIVGNTLDQEENKKKCSKLEVFDCSSLIGEAMKRNMTGGSVSELFNYN